MAVNRITWHLDVLKGASQANASNGFVLVAFGTFNFDRAVGPDLSRVNVVTGVDASGVNAAR